MEFIQVVQLNYLIVILLGSVAGKVTWLSIVAGKVTWLYQISNYGRTRSRYVCCLRNHHIVPSINQRTHTNQAYCLYRQKEWTNEKIPGNFFGFLIGTNFAPIASAIGGPNMKPLASTPAEHIQSQQWALLPKMVL